MLSFVYLCFPIVFLFVLNFSVSVCGVAWYHEDRPFVIAFSDGKVVLSMRDEECHIATIDACQSAISSLKWDPTGIKKIF